MDVVEEMATEAIEEAAEVHPTSTLLTALGLYLPILLISALLFEIIQSWLVTPNPARDANFASLIYAARARTGAYPCPVALRTYRPFAWIWPVLRVSDDEIFLLCGLDTLFFLRVLRMGQKFALAGIGLSAILFPIYATATHPLEKDRAKIDPLERIAMSNLDRGEPRIWSSVLAMYAMSFLAFYLFKQEYKIYIRRRHEFLGQLGAQQYSVVVNDLPERFQTPAALGGYMQFLFPGSVHSVSIAVETAGLEGLISERLAVRDALEDALAAYAETHRRPTHRPGPWWRRWTCTSTPVDSIQYLQVQLDNLNASIMEQIQDYERRSEAELARRQEQLVDAGGDRDCDPNQGQNPNAGTVTDVCMRPSAFISFMSLQAAQSFQQLLQADRVWEMSVSPAPDPQDVVWENYGQPHRLRESWQIISWLLTILIIFFWTGPSTFVASLASVGSLRELIPGLDRVLEDTPWLMAVLQQASPLGLALMSLLANHIFGFLSRREGWASGDEIAASLFAKLIYFQMFQVFFVSVIAGTVLDSLNDIINEPKIVISLLGATLPGKAVTFMAYLILQAGLKLTIQLLLLVPFVLGALYQACAPARASRRELPWLGFIRAPSTGQGQFEVTERLTHYFLAMLLVFAFCAIAPLLSYIALFFFLASDVVYRRLALFVYDPAKGSTGAFWPELHDFLVGGLLLAQITFLGLTSLKVAPGPVAMATVLPFFTVAYFLYARSRWPRVGRNLPLSRCRELDERRGKGTDWGFLEGVYRQPALSEKESLHPDVGNGHGESEGDRAGGVAVAVLESESSTGQSPIGLGADLERKELIDPATVKHQLQGQGLESA